MSFVVKMWTFFSVFILCTLTKYSTATVDFNAITNVLGNIHNQIPFHVQMPFHVHVLPGAFEDYDDNGESGQPAWCQACTCGLPNRGTRIVGGRPTLINEFPWVAALSRNGKLFCGATLINDRYVLTAAHCVEGSAWMTRMNTMVILAEHNTAQLGETATETRRVSAVHRHPDFRPTRGNFDGDLALLQLSSPVRFRAELSPACLPDPGHHFSGQQGTVAGWGRVSESGQPSAELQVIDVPIMSHEECLSETAYSSSKLTKHMLCAGPLNGGTDSCQGDSGGALMVEDDSGRLVTAGVVSWGEGCARPSRPGVYTRVNHYLAWVQRITKDACYCS